MDGAGVRHLEAEPICVRVLRRMVSRVVRFKSDVQVNEAVYTRGMAKRGYSREFTPKTERRVRIEVDRIPPTLYNAVSAKAKREGISLRALVLKLLSEWVER